MINQLLETWLILVVGVLGAIKKPMEIIYMFIGNSV